MNSWDAEELARLRKEFELSGLGDRPQSMAAAKLGRLMQLKSLERQHTPFTPLEVCDLVTLVLSETLT